MFKGGEGGMKEEYEKLEKMYQVAQEELQVKIEEVELEHQKQAALKLRHETMLEEIGVSKAQCEAQISKLQSDLESKRLECDGLQSSLDAERQRYTQLFSEIQSLKGQYQTDQTRWKSEKDKLIFSINEKDHQRQVKIPFDPFQRRDNEI